MSDQAQEAPQPAPSPEELEEILADLDFFLEMEEADSLPLEIAVTPEGGEEDE